MTRRTRGSRRTSRPQSRLSNTCSGLVRCTWPGWISTNLVRELSIFSSRPTGLMGGAKKTSKRKICGSKVLVEIAQRYKVKKSYVALQTEYANWCQAHLDPGIHGGRPKSETGADHLPVDLYKEALHRELQRAEREAASQVERILNAATAEALAIVEKAEEEAVQVRRARLKRQRRLGEQAHLGRLFGVLACWFVAKR